MSKKWQQMVDMAAYHEQFCEWLGEVVQHELDLGPELVGFELEPVPLEQ